MKNTKQKREIKIGQTRTHSATHTQAHASHRTQIENWYGRLSPQKHPTENIMCFTTGTAL